MNNWEDKFYEFWKREMDFKKVLKYVKKLIHDNRVDQDYYKSLQKDLAVLYIGIGVALASMFTMFILIVMQLI